MKKTSLYIEPEVDHALARLAESQGLSKAEVIRRALREAANGAPPARVIGIGTILDAPSDVSENVDHYLALTGFGES